MNSIKGKFKVLTKQANDGTSFFVDTSWLFKEIKPAVVPQLFLPSTTVDSMIAQVESLLPNVKMRKSYLRNIRQCNLIDVDLIKNA